MPTPIASSPLAPNEVQVWAVSTDPFAAPKSLPGFFAVLSAEERRIARRFRTGELTERYVVSHALLRHVVGRYVDAAPDDVRITTDRRGRPTLPDHPDTDFNLSHTEGMAVVAVTRGTVGVDVERVRDDIDVRAVSKRVFSDAERATIRGDVAAKQTPFFDYWTLKEAYAKAIGLGVRVSFRDIDVSLGEPMTVDLNGVDDDSDRWTFDLFGCDRYRLAVVVRREQAVAADVRLIEVDGELRPRGPLSMTRLKSTRPAYEANL